MHGTLPTKRIAGNFMAALLDINPQEPHALITALNEANISDQAYQNVVTALEELERSLKDQREMTLVQSVARFGTSLSFFYWVEANKKQDASTMDLYAETAEINAKIAECARCHVRQDQGPLIEFSTP